MMSLLDVKYILDLKKDKLESQTSLDSRFPQQKFSLVWQDDTWRIWQYRNTVPRVVFATDYIVLRNPQAIVDELYNPNVKLDQTVILEEDPNKTIEKPKTPGATATILLYDLNTIKIRTDSLTDGFVLLTDNYYPGWIVSVDGRREKLYRADYAFKAVYVTRGVHTVVFQYVPRSVMIGGFITLIGIIATLRILVIQRSRRLV